MLNQSSKKEHVSDFFDLLTKTKFQIFTFLNMYGKLSLTEIAQKLNKSKSTIHGHIKKMKEAKAIKEEKRPIFSDPKSNKPKVFENVYSINPEFGTEFDDLIPGLNPEKLNSEQAKVIIDTMLFLTKMRIANLKVQQQFFEKIDNSFAEEPEKMKDLTKKLISGLFNPECEINEDNFGKTSGRRSHKRISAILGLLLLLRNTDDFANTSNRIAKPTPQKSSVPPGANSILRLLVDAGHRDRIRRGHAYPVGVQA